MQIGLGRKMWIRADRFYRLRLGSIMLVVAGMIVIVAGGSLRDGWQRSLWSSQAARVMVAVEQDKVLAAGPVDHPRQLAWRAKWAIGQGKSAEAISLLSSWVLQYPDDVISHAVFGTAWYASGDWQAAADGWRRAGDWAALMEAGWHAHRQQRHEESLYFFRKAWDLQPQATTLGLAAALQSQGDLSQAETILRRSLLQFPAASHRIAWQTLLADVIGSAGRWLEALTLYQEVLVAEPVNAEAYIGMGRMYKRLNEVDAAITALQQGITLAPDDARGYEALGDIMAEQQRYAEADAYYQQALGRAPDRPWLWVRRGNTALAAGDFFQAIETYRKALGQYDSAFEPVQKGYLFRYLALSYLKVGDLAQAREAIRNSVANNPSDKASWILAGQIYEALGQKDLALVTYRQALALEPSNEALRKNVERLEK